MTLSTFSAISLISFMFGLGCDLRTEDFRPVLSNFKAVLIGSVAQILGHPLLSLVIVYLVPLSPEIQLGLIIIASCPGGPSANMFSWLARADVPLCVTLTALTSVITVFTIPIILKFATSILHLESANVSIDFTDVFLRLVSLSLLPLVLGMFCLRFFTRFAKVISTPLKVIALLQLVVLIVGVLVVGWKSLAQMSRLEVMAVGLLLSLAMIQAFSISSLFSLTSKQKRSIVSEVGIQNAVQGVAIAAMIAENVETSRFALPSVVYALAMYPAVSAYVFYVRNRG